MEIRSSKRIAPLMQKKSELWDKNVKQQFAKKSAEEWIDTIKSRSTLVGLVEPVGVAVGFVSQPMLNLRTLGEGASSIFKGDFGQAGEALNSLVGRAYDPHGIGGKIYDSAQVISAVTGAAVGGLEIYAGLKTKNKYLAMMGGADLVGAAGTTATLMDANGLGLALSIASTATKTGLVLARPKEYTRTQKVKTLLDASGSLASAMLKNGFLVAPALAVSAVAGVGQIAYMNHPGFRNKVDAIIDKIFKRKGFGDTLESRSAVDDQ